MKNSPNRHPSQSVRVSLSQHELSLVLGAIAETLEEKRQPYTRTDLARLVRLHRRLDLLDLSEQPDYDMAETGVVCARSGSVVVAAPGQGWTQLVTAHG